MTRKYKLQLPDLSVYSPAFQTHETGRSLFFFFFFALFRLNEIQVEYYVYKSQTS